MSGSGHWAGHNPVGELVDPGLIAELISMLMTELNGRCDEPCVVQVASRRAGYHGSDHTRNLVLFA